MPRQQHQTHAERRDYPLSEVSPEVARKAGQMLNFSLCLQIFLPQTISFCHIKFTNNVPEVTEIFSMNVDTDMCVNMHIWHIVLNQWDMKGETGTSSCYQCQPRFFFFFIL